jgi:acyl carrier protein
MQPVRETLRHFIVENFLLGQSVPFSDDDSLIERGLVDSTGVLELVAFLEERFEIGVEDEEIVPDNLDSIDNLVRFLASKLEPCAVS